MGEEYEKLLSAFRAYVENDAEATDAAYVVDVLKSLCGLSEDDIREYGLGWLLIDE